MMIWYPWRNAAKKIKPALKYFTVGLVMSAYVLFIATAVFLTLMGF